MTARRVRRWPSAFIQYRTCSRPAKPSDIQEAYRLGFEHGRARGANLDFADGYGEGFHDGIVIQQRLADPNDIEVREALRRLAKGDYGP